jgi:outer membrane protein OmpA-like peptidoglycan-associated protein
MRRSCLTGGEACQAACNSKLYSFMPLRQDALSVCPPKEVYVVLPNADGRPGVGAITVSGEKTSTTLDRAYAAAAGLGGGDPATLPMTESETDGMFKRAIGARPILPRRFIINFALGSAQPGAESAAGYQALLNDIRDRPVYEIEVAGYTDTVSGPSVNQKLSLDRANVIRQPDPRRRRPERACDHRLRQAVPGDPDQRRCPRAAQPAGRGMGAVNGVAR